MSSTVYNYEQKGACLMNVTERYPYLLNTNHDEINKRYNDAWEKARSAARVLKDSFFAEKVILFGSLLDKNSFDMHSDIDLAVLGVPDRIFYKALGSLAEVVFPFNVDLVDINDCKESLKKVIESEGVQI